jgi:hypothetical protein
LNFLQGFREVESFCSIRAMWMPKVGRQSTIRWRTLSELRKIKHFGDASIDCPQQRQTKLQHNHRLTSPFDTTSAPVGAVASSITA